jgi:hypothetical protein
MKMGEQGNPSPGPVIAGAAFSSEVFIRPELSRTPVEDNIRAHSRRANEATYANRTHTRRRVKRDGWAELMNDV